MATTPAQIRTRGDFDTAVAAQHLLDLENGDRPAAQKLVRDTDAALTAMGLMYVELGRQLADVADCLRDPDERS